MKIGFIGCGNMATAMLKGILKSGEVEASDMIASAKSDKTREKIEKDTAKPQYIETIWGVGYRFKV